MYAEPGQRLTILTFASNKLARGASISTHVSELSEDKVLRAAMQFNLIKLTTESSRKFITSTTRTEDRCLAVAPWSAEFSTASTTLRCLCDR